MRLFRLLLSVFVTATLGLVLGWFWNSSITTPVATNLSININQATAGAPVPLIAVAPHHNLVAVQRQQFFAQLTQQSQPSTIILISPNHFDLGQANVLTTDRTWDIQNGQVNILPDADVVRALEVANVARVEDEVFSGEHGIKNMLDDIHASFPKARLVPIIFKSSTTPAEVANVTSELLTACHDCGLIASVDMSHYQPAAVADIHDIKTLRALTNLDEDDIWNVEVDSNASLAVLLEWAKAHEVHRFTLFDHTNSGFIAQNPDTETTTHLFGSYSAGEPIAADKAFTFTFAGDAMFGRLVQNFQNDYTQLFTQLGNRTFWGTDISWINLEGPLSDQSVRQITKDDPLIFNFPPQTLSALTYLKLTTVGLANNHTYNQGAAGLQTTRDLLTSAGVDWVGDPNQISADLSLKRYTAGQQAVSLIAVSAFGNLAGLEDLIRAEKAAGQFVIVLPHWGVEYQPTHSSQQHTLASTWSSAGADLIIGMHPHVIQDAELINHTLVFYSLGNFVFDQTFSTATQQGLLLTGEVTDAQVKIVLVPIQSVQLKPQILQGQTKQDIISHVCQNISSICSQGVITLPREPAI